MVTPTNNPQPSEPESNQTPRVAIEQKTLPWWRLAVPLVLQTVLILAVPAQQVYTHVTGKTVILQTRPVDPYDIMRGYYQILSYEISDINLLKTLPGWSELENQANSDAKTQTFYVIMAAPDNPQTNTPPTPWQPIKIMGDRPQNLEANQVAIEGKYINQWEIIYGLETYYMPEDQRERINDRIWQAQRNDETFVVEIKVDSSGNATPVSLWVRDVNYRF